MNQTVIYKTEYAGNMWPVAVYVIVNDTEV